ncbi:MAG TPA: hypothetical protein VK837_09080 [Longimicrobiales bacterium]|nr:hypothetical protein [Longimicrobiales bacterium]
MRAVVAPRCRENLHAHRFACTAAVALLVLLAGCTDPPTAPLPGAVPDSLSPAAIAAERSSAPFKVVRQDFNHGTALWSDNDIEGFGGWCGDIRQIARGDGPVGPSAGRGYALVSHGTCNAFWTAEGFTESAPYAPALDTDAFSSRWIASGYVQLLDVYLDPSEEALAFQYAVSIHLLDSGEFRYFAVDVGPGAGGLLVGTHALETAGWYTFALSFQEAPGGGLSVEFQLRDDGRVIASQALDQTLFTMEDPSSFAVENVGTGESWFSFISPGIELPIDEFSIRPGR